MNIQLEPIILKWKRFKSEAIIPTKRRTDVGYDIYTTLEYACLEPHQTMLFPTGLGCKPGENHWLQVVDRGSTGSNGIHVHSGIIDEQYTGEIFIALCNTNNFPIVFTKDVKKIEKNIGADGHMVMYYPLSKAIAQIIPQMRFDAVSEEIDDAEWAKFANDSERGDTKLGQSGK